MEVIVPLMVDGLVAIAVWLVSGSGAHSDEAPVRCAWRRAVELRWAVLLRIAGVLGCRAPRGVLSLGFARRLVEEWSRRTGDLPFARQPSPSESIGLFAMASMATAAMGSIMVPSPLGALIGLIAPGIVLMVAEGRRRRHRERLLEEAMPEAFNALSISLGSGHSLAQALSFVGSHAREPIKTEFMRASFALSCGTSAQEALDQLLRRMPAPGLDLVVLALKISQRTGAPLQQLLAQASGMVGERIKLERLLEVKTAQARMSARVVASMPLAMIAILTFLSEDFREGLATPVGLTAVIIALLLNLTAWYVIHRIMEVRF